MEIKRLAEEKYSDISVLLNEMLVMVPHLNDLCFINHNGKRYLLSFTYDKIGIIDVTPNKDGYLNRYSINLDGTEFETEESKYSIATEDEGVFIERDDILTKNVKFIGYYPNDNCSGNDKIAYINFIHDLYKATTITYDVTERKGTLGSKVAYIGYHVPDCIEISYHKDGIFGGRTKEKKFDYYGKDEVYVDSVFRIMRRPFLIRDVYNPKDLFDYLKENEFDLSISDDMKNMLTGNHEEYKTLKLVSDEYKKYISKGI